MKYRYFISALLIFCLFGFSLKENPNSSLAVESDVIILDKSFVKEYPPQGYKLDISYPKILCRHSNVSFQMNSYVHATVSSAIDVFIVKARKYFSDRGVLNTFKFDYEVLYQRGNLISIRFNGTADFQGNEKSMKYTRVFNYDLHTQEIPNLKDLFENKYEHVLIASLEKYYKKDFSSISFNKRTLFGFDHDYLVVYLKDENLPSNAPKAYKVPWKSLKHVVKPDGIVPAILK